jgi:RNA polymerase sigma-70 factor (ECF subfamily)
MTTKLLQQPHDRTMDELVLQARSDREAFGRLYDEIYSPVFRYCIRRTGNRSLAEDITSTVFVNVATAIKSFPGQTFVDFRRWVFVVATNELNADYRKTERRHALLVEAAESGRLPVKARDDAASAERDLGSVQAALLRLDERDRTIITLRFFSELPYEDVANILNITAGAARTAASRAIRRIRADIGDLS